MRTTNTSGGWPSETFSLPAQLIFFPFSPDCWPAGMAAPLITGPMKIYSEEEALALLFPTAQDRKRLAAAERTHEEEIRAAIRAHEMNPIRGWRIIRGMDQKELCRLTGLKQPNISRMEKPGAAAETQNLKKIADAFGIGIEELIP
jgi:predicted XRE-type DNA-binding protein